MNAITPITPSSATPASPTRLQVLLTRLASGGSSLRHRNFRLFFFGQLISLIGTWTQSVAQQWLVYTLTHSAFQLGVVSTFQFLPVMLLTLYAGTVVDRLPKRAIIVTTQTLFLILAAILGLLTLAGTVQIWQVYIIAALYGTVNAFDIPARQAFMVEMVGRDDLLNGIALNSSIFNAARIFGPAIATWLIAKTSTGICFMVNAASFVPVIAGLLLMVLPRVTRPAAVDRRPLCQIADGLGYIRRHERIWLVFFIATFINIFGIPMYATLMPIFATQVLHSDIAGLGVLNVGVGAGAFIGALVLAYLPPGPARSRILLFGATAMSVLLLCFAGSQALTISTLLMVGIGFSVVSVNSAGNAIIQEMTPHYLRGRVMSVWGLTLVGLTPLGSFFAGTLAEHLGAPAAVAIGSIICLAAALATNLLARRRQAFAATPAISSSAPELDLMDVTYEAVAD